MEENKDLTQSMENAASAQNPQTENEEQGQQERAPFRMRRRINNAEKVEPFSRYHQSERDDFERPMRRYNSYSDSHYQRAPRPDRPYSDNQDSYRNDGRPANQWGRANGRNHNEYRTGNPRYNSYNNPYSNSNNGHYQNRYANQENQDSYQVYEPQQQYSPRSRYNYQKPYGEPYNQYDENNGNIISSLFFINADSSEYDISELSRLKTSDIEPQKLICLSRTNVPTKIWWRNKYKGKREVQW